MIGNDWISDIGGAQNYGLDTVYIHSNISPQDTVIEKIHADLIIPDGDVNRIKEIVKM